MNTRMKSITRREALKLAAIAGIFNRRRLRHLYLVACSVLVAGLSVIYTVQGKAQTPPSPSACSLPPAGSVVTNPPEILNPDASNPANFTVVGTPSGQDCYLVNGNLQAPTLRLTPGKKDFVLRLTNQLSGQSLPVSQEAGCDRDYPGGMAPLNSTNLHYHGLNVYPQCTIRTKL